MGEEAHLRLDVGHLVDRENVLVQRHARCLEVPQEAKLRRHQEQQRTATAAGACRASDTVDVFLQSSEAASHGNCPRRESRL